ncbi:FAD-dependent oxidoreductase [Leptolyngbya cf. ectocarpi LEGE 11479]|uniref:FAD-dependent oxidoreductase n=1 Tax=Leptolyngbya cf. ectocarpi LEGE 11479 TaxID=1828722 RepID=A0A928X046_LEPEC|nr:NAD(P)/FAD-dependent oxidoreductase [Leptolyngbya ectocarpi]MBE9066564.1 FAD-dependent oxidoreductase [Leptolyngbya cf. ectocarpi LEGE 11479]
MDSYDIVVIGSGIGGLVAAGLLARYGRRVLVCESHTLPGGAAHAFKRQGFTFDSGPSFYCGLADPNSCNPLREVLTALGESIATVTYDPLGHYHFPDRTLAVYGDADRYQASLAEVSPQAAQELKALTAKMLAIYRPLGSIPTLALRADGWLLPVLAQRYPKAMLQLLPQLRGLGRSMGDFVDETVQDPWLRQLIDLECFLLSGMKAHDTVAPEMAFMFGERTASVIDYPMGGSGALVEALVRGLERWGGQIRLGTHVNKIWVENNRVQGVILKTGERIRADQVISNATLWDTCNHLLEKTDLPARYRQRSVSTIAVDSFMHLHLGIRAAGLEDLTIHHVVVHDTDQDITTPGNTCMISIPSVLDPSLAPEGHHVVHAYTLEPWDDWQQDTDNRTTDRAAYEAKKEAKSKTLIRALQKVMPDICDRITLKLIGTPLTHQRFLRRHQGTYGPAIAAGQGLFPGCKTPIKGLYRVGDSTLPGIGVPAVAASGILCANSLVSPREALALLDL